MTERRYGDPAALRQALTDQLRRLALARPVAQLADLQRQFAYDRLLARVFVAEPEAWVVQGATALLARMHGSARHTVGIDLYRRYAGLDEAELALRAAAALDLGDFFRFGLSPGRQVAQGRATLRIPVIAYLGATEFARFHVDLVTDLLMTGEPDEVAALAPFGTFSHETALALLGLSDIIPATVHLTIPETSRLRARPGVTLHRSRHGATADRVFRDGLWVSTARRALLDAARAGADPDQLVAAAHDARARAMLTLADLADLRHHAPFTGTGL